MLRPLLATGVTMTTDTPHPCRSCGVPVYTGNSWTYCTGTSQYCYNTVPQRSKSLRDALYAGLAVVCNVAPYEGHPVEYSPGYTGTHPRPWVLPGTGLRFSGKDCLAMPQPPRAPVQPSRGGLFRFFGHR